MVRLYKITLFGFEGLTALLIFFHFQHWWTIPLGFLAAMQLTIILRILIIKLPGMFNVILGILLLCFTIYLLLYSVNIIDYDKILFFNIFKTHPVLSIIDFFLLFIFVSMVADMDFIGKAGKYIILSSKSQNNNEFGDAENHLLDMINFCNSYENRNIKLSLHYKIIGYLSLTQNCKKKGESEFLKAEEYSEKGISICNKALEIIEKKKNSNTMLHSSILKLREELKSLYNELSYSEKYILDQNLLKPKA